MEATTIDQLFPEVLAEVFSHLSASDVKNCALVCKNWDDVIGSSEITMKKFELKFHVMDESDGDSQKQDESQQRHSTREHRNLLIIIQSMNPPTSILDHFDLSKVKKLTFLDDLTFDCSNILSTLLSRTPLLEDLKISLYYTDFDNADFPIVTFAKLRKLCVDEGSIASSIFKFIEAPNITDLEYTEGNLCEYSDWAKIDSMAAFIKDKRNLSSLSLSAKLFQKLIGRHEFSEMRIESLNVCSDFSVGFFLVHLNGSEPELLEYSDTAQVNFKKLLLSNADSLTSLQLFARFITKEVFVAIFSGLRKLATLYIVGDVNLSGSWMENLSPNITLKSLAVTQNVMNDGLQKILQLAPHIESLRLSSATDSVLSQVAASNRGLVKLEIHQLQQSVRGDLRFTELKSLKLDEIKNVDFLSSMLVSCPTIETFEFCNASGVEVITIVDLLLQQNTLKHLRMRSSPPNDCRFIFDQLKVNYGNLRSATFYMRGGKFLQFDFPENPAEWNVEEQNARFSSYLTSE